MLSKSIKSRDKRYLQFFQTLFQSSQYQLNLEEEKRILDIDLPRTFGINKRTGQIFQTAFRVTRLLKPASSHIITSLGIFRKVYNKILSRSQFQSYFPFDLLIDVADNRLL